LTETQFFPDAQQGIGFNAGNQIRSRQLLFKPEKCDQLPITKN